MNNKNLSDSSRQEFSQEQLEEKLANQIYSHPDSESIRERKKNVQNKIFVQIKRQKRQKEQKFIFISIAASLLLLLGLGYRIFINTPQKSPISWVEISTPNGVRDSVLLADGSKIVLNGGSTLKYPKQFIGKTREVSFTGEGYFEIAKNTEKPFLINTENIEVKVLGTKFNLKAYTNDTSVETILEDGCVEIRHPASDQTQLLIPNDCVVFDKQMNTFSTTQVDPLIASMWRTGKYTFYSTPLLEFTQTLERGFGVTFIIENKDALSKRFTGDFVKGESIDDILKILQLGSTIKYQKENNIITIK